MARRSRPRLERGPLPLARALEYATQIVDALDKSPPARRHPPRLEARERHAGEVGREAARFRTGARPRAASVAADECTHDSRTLTAKARSWARFQYISPEQLEGKDADARTDIFAFGALVYEMITGKPAFRAARPRRT